jgi:acyl dehydratase
VEESIFGRWFDDLEIGDRAVTRGRTLTEADLVAFSGLTGDRHPQHVDAVWAAASPFGERIAHGMLLLSYAVGLAEFDPRRVVALRSVERCVFKRPGKIGDTMRADCVVTALTPIDDERGLVGLGLKIRSERDLLARAEVAVVWRRGPAR